MAELAAHFASSDDDEPGWRDVAKAARDLETRGYAVVDGAWCRAEALNHEVEALHAACLLATSPNAVADAILTKRGVFELTLHFKGRACMGPEHAAARELCPTLRGFASGAARELGARLGEELGARLVVDEVKAQHQDATGCFPAHFDTTDGSGRVVTAILYLCDDWRQGDGGELQLFPLGHAARSIAPLFNRLLLFSSTTMLHRTLPWRSMTRPRRCVSVWFRSDSSFRLAQPPLCARCFDRDLVGALDDEGRRRLAKLAWRDAYATSFRDAFDDSPSLRAALRLDERNNASALAALAAPLRAALDRTCKCR